MQASFHRWMDDLLKNAYSPETLFRMAGSMGIDLSQLSGKTDPYRVLGLDKTATDKEVKKRYHALLVILHPDTAKEKGTEYFFMELVAAYQQIGKERSW
ncbi:MAG: J domain-containing protein [Dehalococcoidales bacterium]|nr:J domain-containing protein [Dehalococcoidales bacterium]